MGKRRVRRTGPMLGLAMVLALVGAACGSSEADDTQGAPTGAEATSDGSGGDATDQNTPEGNATDDAADPLPVSMAVQQSSLNTVLHAVAVAQGSYEDHGLAVEVTTFPSGQGPSGAEQLLQGQADIAIASSLEFMRANSVSMESGDEAPLAVVALALPCPTNLVLAEGVEYTGPESLAGLTIGVSSFTSTHLQLIGAYLREDHGLTQDEVGWDLIEMSGGNMPPALASQQVDGFLHSEPTASIAIRDANGHIGLSCADGGFGRVSDTPTLAIATSRDYLSENPDTVRSVVQALEDATQALDTLSTDEKVAIFVEWTGAEPELVEAGMDRIRPGLNDPSTWDVLWDVLASVLRERGEISEDLQPSDVFDFSASYPDVNIDLGG